MFGVSDLGKMAKEIERLHELTDETAKLVTGVNKLNKLVERQNELLERLVVAMEQQAAPKKKRS